MGYKFKYHPDSDIYKNGVFYKSYSNFKKEYPDFPIIEGQFFELKTDGTLELIKNINGTFTGFKQTDLAPFKELITAIGE